MVRPGDMPRLRTSLRVYVSFENSMCCPFSGHLELIVEYDRVQSCGCSHWGLLAAAYTPLESLALHQIATLYSSVNADQCSNQMCIRGAKPPASLIRQLDWGVMVFVTVVRLVRVSENMRDCVDL